MPLNVGTLSGMLELDANPFERSLDRSMQSGAQKATAIGGKMTKSLTLPLVAAGGAAVKMGVDFDTSMSRMVGLVGLSTDEVGKLKSGIMDLSGETAKSPQELADAMFTVTSAGFRGAEAMDVLTSAAKASAAGLGETRTIAEALTGAVNAYGPEVLDAARATDILVATARAGNFESSQLAGVLGKITPFAKQAGASLEDVGGSIALLTRVNNNATESGTQVAAMLRAFVAPGGEAVNTFNDLYGSTQAFRDMIAENGLVSALKDLDGKLGGNREELAKLLGSSEAQSAAFQILDADAETLAGTFGTVQDSAGMLDEGFNAAADTAGFKLQQALADLQIALIEAGAIIAPFVADVAGGLSTVAEAFSALPSSVQGLVVGFAALLAAVGPMASIGGKIATNWRTITGLFDKAAMSAYDLSGNVGKLAKNGAALAVAGVLVERAINAWRTEMSEANDDAQALATTLAGDFDPSKASMNELHEELMRLGGDIAELDRHHDEALNPFLRARYAETSDELGAVRDKLLETEAAAAEFQSQLGISADEALRMATNSDVMAAATDNAAGEIDAAAGVTEQAAQDTESLADAIRSVTDAWRAQIDPFFAAQDAMIRHRDAQQAVTEAEWKVIEAADKRNTAIKEHGEQSDEATEATFNLLAAERDLEDRQRELVRSAGDASAATYELKRMMDESELSIDGAKNMLSQWVAQGYLTEEQARQAANELGLVAWNAGLADGKRVDIPVNVTGFESAIFQLDQLARRANTPLIVNASVRARDAQLERRHSGGRVTPDMAYLTGGYGHEELFVPDSAGTVFSHAETEGMLGGSARRGGGGGTIVADLSVNLDGRKIGSSRSVIEGMESAKAKRSRNTGGR